MGKRFPSGNNSVCLANKAQADAVLYRMGLCALTLSLGASSKPEGKCLPSLLQKLLYFHVFMPETRMSCQKLILHLRELKSLKEVEGKNNHESRTKQRNHVNKLINCLEAKYMFVILPLSKGN